MSVRDQIVLRSGIIYFMVVLLAMIILGKIVILQFVQKDKWAKMGETFVFKKDMIPSNRGDILDCEGRILASSVPFYSLYMDTRSTGMTAEVWKNGIDGLAKGLSQLVGVYSAQGWKNQLASARRNGSRYFLIKKRVSYETLKEVKKLPIFREGRYKGGLVTQVESRRVFPQSGLAARTIGYLNQGESGNVVGLEGAFDKQLAGTNGEMMMQRLTGGDWLPVESAGSVEPRNGNDIFTTIDIDIQDVAESALKSQLARHNARYGTAILMEVRTGNIKAIVNLEKGKNGGYSESYNYAIGESTEPGSTFKLPALMVALEDGIIDLTDTIDTGKGSVKYYNKTIQDTKKGGYGKITVKQVFELSSNVGTSIIINEGYKKNPKKFVDGLYAMKLNQKLNISLSGEGIPLVRSPGDKLWSGISLPMMSHGYEVQMTPLQILTFYNAVANNGKMVKPRFVTEVSYHGSVIERFPTEVISGQIASRSTIKKAREMLEGVVERGTAMNLRDADYKIAGKTGTAQIANAKYGYRTAGVVSYQASFVGYFPADNPLYSCIVVVNAPSNAVYYGNLVAGPVFKEIADKVYSSSFFNNYPEPGELIAVAPEAGNGNNDDIMQVIDEFDLKYIKGKEAEWIRTRESGDTIRITAQPISKGLMPDVRGMSLRDALYILENEGMKVRFSGRGRVLRQSPEPGARIYNGSSAAIELKL